MERILVEKAIKLAIIVVNLCFLIGCSASQLNNYTANVANLSNNLVTQQALYNFSQYLDNKAAMPSQIVVSAGTTSVTNTFIGSITSPLTPAFQSSNVVADQVSHSLATGAGAAGATTNTANSSQLTGTGNSQRTLASAGLSASANNVAGAAYTFAFVTDPQMMGRLTALYRYTVDWSAQADGEKRFKGIFPLIRKTEGHNVPECTTGLSKSGKSVAPTFTSTTTIVDGPPQEVSFCVTSATTSGNLSHSGATLNYNSQVTDGAYLSEPDCILCGPGDNLPVDSAIRVVHLNKRLQGPWLHWSRTDGQQVPAERVVRDGDTKIGASGNYIFYVSDPDSFVRFNIAVLSASTQSSSTTAGGGNAAAQAARASAPYAVVLPVQ